ncbi:MAG: peptide chain release factor N(5)-glutamine methyltransferase [Candidatus Polarisedimenticolia bacterium]
MPPSPLAALLSEGIARLQAAGIESSRLDAELLLAHVLGVERGRLALRLAAPGGEGVLDDPGRAAYLALIDRRCRHEPVAYLTGRREFWSLDLQVSPGVLVPRPDTELVVEVALRALPAAVPARVLDVGTGSGAIAIALAVERPRAWVTAIDLSPEALAIARANARRHGVSGRVAFARMDLASGLALPHPGLGLDLVAANPPYIALSEREDLMPEVRDHEPSAALFGGPTGMDIVERLIPEASRLLRPGGWLVLECAAPRAHAVADLLRSGGVWHDVALHDDLSGLPRVAAARRAGDQGSAA